MSEVDTKEQIDDVQEVEEQEVNVKPISASGGDDATYSLGKTVDIFIRMNDDFEKDYCFVVGPEDTFRDLQKIFTCLPLSLSPSFFHKSEPSSFALSKKPGFLTPTGTLLFDYDSHQEKYLKKVPQDAKIFDHVWPEQLVVPVWDWNNTRWLVVTGILFIWLYMDLPDLVSPTPGHSPTTLIVKLVLFIIDYFGNPPILSKTIETLQGELHEVYSLKSQLLFFAFHTLKVIGIYSALSLGVVNPLSLNPKEVRERESKLSPETFFEIGWAGVRRATIDEWKEVYRGHVIKEVGGIVKANELGTLKSLNTAGVRLGEGEGFDTPTSNMSAPLNSMVKSKKFRLCLGWFEEKAHEVEQELSAVTEGTEKEILVKRSEIIKKFRKYGAFKASPFIQEIYNRRKAAGDGDIDEEKE